MHPAKVSRDALHQLTDLPKIGVAMARDLQRLGIQHPEDLREQDALALYHALCARTGSRQDPCVLDVFLAVCDFINGGEAKAWWAYTAERKKRYPDL